MLDLISNSIVHNNLLQYWFYLQVDIGILAQPLEKKIHSYEAVIQIAQ